MTWITDDTGTRWVEIPQPKRRKSPRALRFADVKVGDQIMRKPQADWCRGIPVYYAVTDLWFDPVAGQDDPLKGSMVGFAQIKPDGSLSSKSATPIRGLASQQYEYADVDYIALCKQRKVEMESGKVIGIGYGKVIQKRPKIAGPRSL